MAFHIPLPKRLNHVLRHRPTKSNIYVAIWSATIIALIASLGYLIYATPHFQDVDAGRSSPGNETSSKEDICVKGILANLGHTGAKAYGAIDGVLLDSPSPGSQDREFNSLLIFQSSRTDDSTDLWNRVRDSSLVFKTLVDRFVRTGDQQLQLAINSFITAQAIIQTTKSPSGTLEDGKGLGEPRFLLNITADPKKMADQSMTGPLFVQLPSLRTGVGC